VRNVGDVVRTLHGRRGKEARAGLFQSTPIFGPALAIRRSGVFAHRSAIAPVYQICPSARIRDVLEAVSARPSASSPSSLSQKAECTCGLIDLIGRLSMFFAGDCSDQLYVIGSARPSSG
jgi:hypothetical protein